MHACTHARTPTHTHTYTNMIIPCSHNLKRGSSANKPATSSIKVVAAKLKVLLKMLCNSETNQDCKTSQVLYLTLFLFCIFVQLSVTSLVPDTHYNTTITTLTNNTSNNSINDNLYVIKAMVYEIGILTDGDNATNDATERQEEVKLSFYNPPNKNKE